MVNIRFIQVKEGVVNLELEGMVIEFDMGKMAEEDEQKLRNVRCFNANYQTLQEQFPDEWVAIWNERVAGHDRTIGGLRQYLDEQGIRGGYLIRRTYVREKSPPRTQILAAA